MSEQLAQQTATQLDEVQRLRADADNAASIAADTAAREIATHESEVQRLTTELNQKQQQIDDLQTEDLEQQELRLLLDESRAGEASLTSKLDRLSAEKESWNAKFEELTSKQAELSEERDDLSRKLDLAEDSAKELQAANGRMESRLNESGAELKTARIDLERAAFNLKKTNRIVAEHKQRVAGSAAELKAKESQRKDLESRLEKLEQVNKELKSAEELAEKNRNDLQSRLEDSEAQAAKSHEEIDRLNQQLEKSQGEHSGLQDSLVGLKEEIAKLNSDKQSLTAENERINQDQQKRLAESASLQESLAQQLETSQAEQSGLQDSIVTLKDEIVTLKSDNRSLIAENERLGQDQQKSLAESASLQEALARQLETSQAEQSILQNSILELKDEIVKLKSKNRSLAAKNEQSKILRVELSGLEGSILGLKDEITELKTDKQSQRINGWKSQGEQSGLQDSIVTLKVAQLKSDNQSLTAKNKRLDQDRQENLKESASLQESLALELKIAQGEQSGLQDSIVTLKEEIATLKSDNQSLTAENERLDQDQQRSLAESASLQESLAQQQDKLEANEIQHNSLLEQLAELNREREELNDATQPTEPANPDLEKQLQAAIESRDSYRLRRRELRKKYKVLFQRWEQAKSGVLDGQQQLSELQIQLQHAEKENGKLNPLREEIKSLHLEVERLREGRQSHEDHFKDFGIKFRKTRMKYKRYKSRMHEYKILLEAYHRVTGLTPAIIVQRDSTTPGLTEPQVDGSADQTVDVTF